MRPTSVRDGSRRVRSCLQPRGDSGRIGGSESADGGRRPLKAHYLSTRGRMPCTVGVRMCGVRWAGLSLKAHYLCTRGCMPCTVGVRMCGVRWAGLSCMVHARMCGAWYLRISAHPLISLSPLRLAGNFHHPLSFNLCFLKGVFSSGLVNTSAI